jgi:hypothetical protein
MGLLIRFPDVWRNGRIIGPYSAQAESATVVILPVVRIERQTEKSKASASRGRRRGQPASRP